MNKYFKHFKTITKHKLLVTYLCFKCGFIKRGLLHDLSKYSPTEFMSSSKYWTGTGSPIDAEKKAIGYSMAWLHHKGRNPHHWEYWIDNLGTYKNTPCEIPYEYIVEMVCDWISAGIVYNKNKVDFNKPYPDTKNYHERFKKERLFHQNTEKILNSFLDDLATNGINHFCKEAKRMSKIDLGLL